MDHSYLYGGNYPFRATNNDARYEAEKAVDEIRPHLIDISNLYIVDYSRNRLATIEYILFPLRAEGRYWDREKEKRISAKQFSTILLKGKYDYVFVFGSKDFPDDYIELFEKDNIRQAKSCYLYKIFPKEEGTIKLIPITPLTSP
jgi:hypothetical protein